MPQKCTEVVTRSFGLEAQTDCIMTALGFAYKKKMLLSRLIQTKVLYVMVNKVSKSKYCNKMCEFYSRFLAWVYYYILVTECLFKCL